jgi:hypothetical protein
LKGEEGAFKVLNIFKEELKIAMALCGKVMILILCALLSQIRASIRMGGETPVNQLKHV